MTTRTDRIQVIFEVGGDGKLKASLADIGKDGEKAAQGLDKANASHERMIAAATRAGAVLGTAVVAGLGLVIKNTIEAERVDAQLEARLKSTAGAAGLTKQALDDLATATARKTTFDDDAIKSTEAMLLTFTKIGSEVFPAAIDAITDMSVAMGTDLQSAAIQVGKALNDPIEGISALSRVGVTFSDQQKEVIKQLVETGQTAEAQKLILQELATEFGGAAEAARDTLGGALIALKNTLMDLTEGGSGSLDGATQAVNEFNDALNDPQTQEGIAALVSGLFDLLGVAAKIPAAFQLMGKFIGTTLAEMQNQAAATGTILRNLSTFGMADGTIKGAMAQSAAGREQYQRALDDMVLGNHGMTRGQYNQQFQSQFNLGLPGTATTQVLGAGSGGGFNFAADQSARSAAGRTVPAGSSGGRAARSSAGGGGRSASAPRAMPDFGDDDLRDLQRLVEETERADEQFARLAATLGGPLSEAQHEYEQNLREIDDLGKKAGRSAEDITALKEQETARYEQQRQEIEASLDPMGQLLDSYQQEIDLMGMGNAERAMANELRRQGIDLASAEAQAYMDAARATDQQARDLADSLGYADDIKSGMKGFLMDLRKDAVGTFKNIGDYFDELLTRMLSRALDSQLDDWFSNLGKGGGGGSGGGGGGFWGSLGGIIGSMFGGGGGGSSASQGASVISAFEGLFQFANGGVMTARGPLPLRAYATGGIANTPQMALFGEGRQPEAFVPLPDGRSIPVTMQGGGGGDTYYITAPINVRGDVTPRTADQLAGRMANKLQRAGRSR